MLYATGRAAHESALDEAVKLKTCDPTLSGERYLEAQEANPFTRLVASAIDWVPAEQIKATLEMERRTDLARTAGCAPAVHDIELDELSF